MQFSKRKWTVFNDLVWVREKRVKNGGEDCLPFSGRSHPKTQEAFSWGAFSGECHQRAPLPITTRCLFSWGVLRNSLHASTIFGARYSSVCNLCLGIRNAQSRYHCALSFLGCVRFAHTDSSAAHMGVCQWRAQRSVKKADESLCQGETGTRERPGLQPAYCPENEQSEESLLSSISLSALPWGH